MKGLWTNRARTSMACERIREGGREREQRRVRIRHANTDDGGGAHPVVRAAIWRQSVKRAM